MDFGRNRNSPVTKIYTSFLCCVANHLTQSGLKQQTIYYLPVSAGQRPDII